jgi:hypothetical protein
VATSRYRLDGPRGAAAPCQTAPCQTAPCQTGKGGGRRRPSRRGLPDIVR